MTTQTTLILCSAMFLLLVIVIWQLRRILLRQRFDEDLRFIELYMPHWVISHNNYTIFKKLFKDCRMHNYNRERLDVVYRQFTKLYAKFLDPTGEFEKKKKEMEITKSN